MIELYLMGQFHLVRNGQPVVGEFRSDKARALLAYLVLEGQRPVARTHLTQLLWEGYEEKTARASLRVALSNLRSLLKPFDLLRTTNQVVYFHHDPVCFSCDALALATQIERLQNGSSTGQRQLIHTIKNDQLLANFEEIDSPPFLAWLHQQRSIYQLQLETLKKRLSGEHVHATANQPRPFVRPKQFVHNLPSSGDSFIGRAAELKTLQEAIYNPEARLVTLVGDSGAGKTRLALEALHSMVARSSYERKSQESSTYVPQGGLYFLEMSAGCHWRATLPVALAMALNIPTQRGPLQRQVEEDLCVRQLLLVLDNTPHDADLHHCLAELLAQAPRVKMLLTAENALSIPGEVVVPIAGISQHRAWADRCAEWQDDSAIQLFIARAKRVRPDYPIDQAAAEQIFHLCHVLSNLPLGIEIAAAAWKTMEFATLRAAIEGRLAQSRTMARDAETVGCDGHQSLAILLDLLWETLAPKAQELLLHLSIFPHHFSQSAATVVSMSSRQQLQDLTQQSLVKQITPHSYRLPTLVRRYLVRKRIAQPQLDNTIWQRFSSYCANELQGILSRNGAPTPAELKQIQCDWSDLLVAWQWARSQEQEPLLKRFEPAMDQICQEWDCAPQWGKPWHKPVGAVL